MTCERSYIRSLYGWTALLALTGLLFHRTLERLFDRWWGDPAYGHGLLVPFAAAYFLYASLRRRKPARSGGSLWGAAALLAAILVFFTGRLGNMLFLEAAAFIGVLGALVLLTEGWAVLAAAALPLAYLIFMCPLPSSLYDTVSANLRLFASAASTVVLQYAGVPATATGNIIYIPGRVLSVEDACSGIRSLFGIAATAAAFAFVVKGGVLRKSVLVLSSAPIAVLTNILRVAGTGFLQQAGYTSLAAGFYHQLEGWVFFVIALAAFFVEYAVLRAVFPIAERTGPRGKGNEVTAEARA